VLGISILLLFTNVLFDLGTVPILWYFLLFIRVNDHFVNLGMITYVVANLSHC
jgi:hypothetical protein